jgi:hypothetical protein
MRVAPPGHVRRTLGTPAARSVPDRAPDRGMGERDEASREMEVTG